MIVIECLIKVYLYSGANVKHHPALNPILRDQDLALGHIYQRHVFQPFSLQFQNCLYIFYKLFRLGVRSNLLREQFDWDTLYNNYITNEKDHFFCILKQIMYSKIYTFFNIIFKKTPQSGIYYRRRVGAKYNQNPFPNPFLYPIFLYII